MDNIIEVNEKEKDLLFEMARKGKYLGAGVEGTCYLSKDEFGSLEAVKILDKMSDFYHCADNVIMDSTFSLKSFAFPKKVYSQNGEVVSYTARYYNDFLKPNSDGIPFIINTELLKNAISRFIDDLKILSFYGIYLNDLGFNLVFDNYNLVAIDTLNYTYKDHDTFEENIEVLKAALKNIFRYSCEALLDTDINFDEEINRLVEIKNETYIKKYTKTISR